MRYGGDLKLTQYFFAPKDDPYHNKKWRELYPEEKLAEIRELARVGTKTRPAMFGQFHPFMNNRIRLVTMLITKKTLKPLRLNSLN